MFVTVVIIPSDSANLTLLLFPLLHIYVYPVMLPFGETNSMQEKVPKLMHTFTLNSVLTSLRLLELTLLC